MGDKCYRSCHVFRVMRGYIDCGQYHWQRGACCRGDSGTIYDVGNLFFRYRKFRDSCAIFLSYRCLQSEKSTGNFQSGSNHSGFYYLLGKGKLAFVVCALKDLILPVCMAIGGSMVMGSSYGLWLGLAVAPVLAICLSLVIVYMAYGKEAVPFLIQPEKNMHSYYCFSPYGSS